MRVLRNERNGKLTKYALRCGVRYFKVGTAQGGGTSDVLIFCRAADRSMDECRERVDVNQKQVEKR
jgi:hypothetical protein